MLAVVDASALTALLFAESDGPAVEERLLGAELIAPDLLPFEVSNVAVQKVRRREVAAAAALSALDLFATMRIAFRAVPPQAAYLAAAASGLTAYDASYLWLAREIDAELVTLDRPLDKAWQRLKSDH